MAGRCSRLLRPATDGAAPATDDRSGHDCQRAGGEHLDEGAGGGLLEGDRALVERLVALEAFNWIIFR